MPLKLARLGPATESNQPADRYADRLIPARLHGGERLISGHRLGAGRRQWLMAAGVLAASLAALASPWSALAAMTFTTRATNWRILDVPQYHQAHGLSCEAAALRMTLASLGIPRSEDSLLGQIGADRRPPYTDSSGFHWGDPYASFVGNVNGSERGLTGYGVYYPPIARVAQANGATVAQAGEGIAPSSIYQAVLAGQPVIAWISFDWIYHRVTHYVAFDGRTVQFGSPYEHAAVVRGVTNGFVLINNPWFGTQWISKSTFESSYATFNNMAVIMGGNAVGPGMSTASSTFQGPTPVPQDTYQPLNPARILDTRDGTGGVPRRAVGPGVTLNLAVSGRGGVPPSGADAVVLNVTVTNTTAPSYLTVYPAGSSAPGTSNLNWTAGVTLANLVTVPIGVNGMVSLFNGGGQTDVLVDVEGWYGPSASPTNAGLFNAVPPARLLDTRSNGGPVGQRQTRNLQVTGRGGVPPAGVAAVALNVTATNASSASNLSIFPAGSALPATSNLNFQAGQSLPNRVIVPVGSGGQIGIFNAYGRVDVVVDVNGWFTDANSAAGGSRFVAIPPQRILDTRSGFGPIRDAGVAAVQFADSAAIGVTAIVANFTSVGAAAPSYLTVWPHGTPQPLASDLNFTTGQTIPNLVVAKLGPSGFDVYNAAGYAGLVIDLNGYYGPVGH
jgi:uncharacterized protein YvpB